MNKNTTKRVDFAFRIAFLFIYVSTMLVPAQTIAAAPAPIQPELELAQPLAAAAPGPKPAAGGYTIASQDLFSTLASAGGKVPVYVSDPITVNSDANASVQKPPANPGAIVDTYVAPTGYPKFAVNGNLTIRPITAYNVIVDSNVLTPASYGPSAATIGAQYCNTSGATMTDVWAYTGDFNSDGDATLNEVGDRTPGVYPQRTAAVVAAAEAPFLAGKTSTDYGDSARTFALEQESGSLGDVTDASRYLGTLTAGQCKTQYWLISYPRIACTASPCAYGAAGATDVTGGVGPEDDLWLAYYFWGTSSTTGSTPSYYWNPLTMRNEISAMANKIWPNGDNKVPPEYVAAIRDVLGWNTWVPGGGTVAYPGQTATSQGIWYDFGNIGAGFDNNGDLIPDRNAWVQPIGDAGSYDPGCFRLVRTYGLVIVKLNDGTELLIPFVDKMYFENVPDNNTGAVGLVYYEYQALDGACSAGLTPYQEVASGYDNEKFNGDFGAGVPPIQSQQTTMTFDKNGEVNKAVGGTITYTLTFTLPDVNADATTTISVGNPSGGLPLTFYETIPSGVEYVTGSASATATMTNPATSLALTRQYSIDSGVTWSTTDPGNRLSTSPNSLVIIRWQFQQAVSSPATGAATTGTVSVQARIPDGTGAGAGSAAYTGKFVDDTACMKIGDGPGFVCDTHKTVVSGNSTITGFAWKDDGITGGTAGDGAVNGTEANIGDGADADALGVRVNLYWDNNGDGDYADAGDFLYATTTTMKYNVIDGYIDVDNDGVTTADVDDDATLPGVNIINGLLDLNADNAITAADDGTFGGYAVIDGFLNIVTGGVAGINSLDDGSLLGAYNFGMLPQADTVGAGNPRYIIVVNPTPVDPANPDIPLGYGPSTTTIYSKVSLAAATTYGDAADASEPSDFGFTPALAVRKDLVTAATVAEGAVVQYTLTVANTLPGSGESGASCKFSSYANAEGSLSTGNNDNASFDDENPDGGDYTQANIFTAPEPDGIYSNWSYLAAGTGSVDGVGFSVGQQSGSITNVKARVKLYITGAFDSNLSQADYGAVEYWVDTNGSTAGGVNKFAGTLVATQAQQNATKTELETHIGIGNVGWYELDLGATNPYTSLAWTWADVSAAANTNTTTTARPIHINYQAGKNASGDAVRLFIDTIALQVTTDATCGTDATILNPVPLADSFDNRYLTFVSSIPANTGYTTNFAANTDQITWANVGALQPGETKFITVNFTAKEQIASPGTYNCDGSTGAKFASGASANSDPVPTSSFSSDNNCAPVIITSRGSLAGRIWNDSKGATGSAPDGWQAGSTTGYDTGEVGIANVTVTLYACTNASNVIYTTNTAQDNKQCTAQTGGKWLSLGTRVTDSTGNYLFDGLAEGFYYVGVTTLPPGAVQRGEKDTTLGDQDGTPLVSGGNSIWGNPTGSGATADLQQGVNSSILFDYLSAGENITNVNFGYNGFTPAIFGYIWQDYNGDGVRDALDTALDNGVTGVTVTSIDCGPDFDCSTLGDNGATVTVNTDTSGFYTFTGLSAGRRYQVTVNTGTLPTGTWTNTADDLPATGGTDTTNVNSVLLSTTLAAGDLLGGFDFGYHKSSSFDIGDTLFYDWDGDATQDAIDEGIPNITVNLYQDLDADGVRDASEPIAGTVVTLPYKVINGYLDIDRDSAAPVDSGDDFTNISGVKNSSGAVSAGADVIDGLIDVDGNGTVDGSDDGTYNGMAVVNGYLDADGDGTTAGDSGDVLEIGQYRFNNVIDATAYIVVVNIADTDFPTNVTETKDPTESGICVVCDSSNTVTLAGADNLSQDFGYQPKGSGTIGDTIFKDINGDGVQGSAELGIAGVTIELQVDKNGDGTYVTLRTTFTDASGKYLFSSLPTSTAGETYRINVKTDTTYSNSTAIPNDSLGNDYKPSTTLSGSDAVTSSGTNYYVNKTITTAAPNALNADFGFAPPAMIGDTVYNDVNGNGTQDTGEPGIQNVVLTLYTFTDALDGKYSAGDTFLIANDTNGDGRYTLGETFTDVVGNGRYDPGETLSAAITTDTTDASGKYQFTNLSPGYYVVVVTSGLPGGISPTDRTYFSGDPSTDGFSCLTAAPNPLNNPADAGEPSSLVCDARDGMRLYNATNYMGADFGYQIPGSVGDTLWIDSDNDGIRDYADANNNGVQDLNEAFTEVGIDNVTVNLYVDVDASGTYTVGDTLSATTSTNADGNYFFVIPTASTQYIIKVDTGDAQWPSGLPTTPVYDPDAAKNSETLIIVNASKVVTTVGTCPGTCDPAGDGDTLKMDADFGYRSSGTASISGTICLDTTTDGFCGTSNTDSNGIAASGEIAYNSVTVYLYKLTDTNSSGTYNSGEATTLVATTSTFAYKVIDGGIDTNRDGVVNGSDDATSFSGTVNVVNGLLDFDNDGVTAGDTGDSGTYLGFTVINGYIDINNNGTTNGEAADDIEVGDYSFPSLPTGVYYVLAIGAPQSGLDLTSTQTTVNDGADDSENGDTNNTTQLVETLAGDGTTLSAFQTVNLTAGTADNVVDRDFAFKLTGSYDFGDLPQGNVTINGVAKNYQYSTTLQGTPDGPRHEQPAGGFTLYLGTAPDVDTNGVASAGADGDTINDVPATNDEGSVTVPLANAENADGWADGLGRINVDINMISGTTTGWLIGWIDYNRDGDFNDAAEMVISQSVTDTGAVQLFDIVTPTTSTPSGGFFSRFRLFASKPAFESLAYIGAAVNGEVEDGIIYNQTPITVSYFRAQRQGSAVNFDWSTATETGNLGFNLYVENDGQLTLINPELIDSKVIDSINRQDYSYSADVAGNNFYIEDVSIVGETRQHGPFHLGQEFGGKLEDDKIDQSVLRTEHDGKFTENQDKIKKDMKVPAAALQATTTQPGLQLTTSLNLKVRQTGIQRVTYEMLKNAGLDLAGVPISKITLTNRGQMMPVYVQGNGKFATGSFIEFYGEALDTIYTDTNIYTLQVSKSPADRIQSNSATAGNGLIPPVSYTEVMVVNKQSAYATYAPGADAWYEAAIIASGFDKVTKLPIPKSFVKSFQVSGLADTSLPASLELVVWGVTNLPSSPHHILVSLNGIPLADDTFVGIVERTIKVSLPAGVLREGENVLQLTLPNDKGASNDIINLDKFNVTYQRVFQAQDGRLTFTSAGKVFNVTNLPTRNVVVYRMSDKGPVRLDKVQVKASGTTFTATFAGSNLNEKYVITTVEALYTPVLEAVRLNADLTRPAQYLIIAHPDFIGGLQPLVQARQAQGLTVSVVDVNDLYTQYSYGIFDPQAIKQYISYAAKNLGTKYVVLIGGDTYDYRNYLGRNSISFVPSLYVATGPLAKFTPVDPLYTDLNNDKVPDVAIGRFPVRSTAELNMMVNKTLVYSGKNYGRTSVFTTDKNDGVLSFKSISANFSVGMPANWTVKNIHMDDLTLANAQSQLITSMNNGTALVTFTGHSSPFAWASSNMFTTKNAAALTNAGRPFVVVQWGCWNTYYVDPINNGLVQSFLFSGDKGAAAVMGAVTLTDAQSELLLGTLITPRLVTPNMTIGQAMQDAKVELAQTRPDLVDVLLGWTLMGDPALVIEP